jgi:uracil-DNA glycosylase
VDVRDKLRAYLEQRRELGESELVLDSMSADEVLRIIGAPGPGTPAVSTQLTPAVQPARESEPSRSSGDSTDWRAALRAQGADPGQRSSSGLSPAPLPPDAPRQSAPPGPVRVASGAPAKLESFGPPGISIGTGARELFGGTTAGLASLADVAGAVATCTRCPLGRTAMNPVPGEGNPNADLMFVGEAPGATEDETGRPFVGQAGQLLTKIIEAIELTREQVFICNVLKHRPPGNRNPMPDEVIACSPYLIRQIELVKPKVIVALGTFAAQTLLETKLSIGKLREQIHRYYGVPLIVTYHPAALLRNPAWKRPTWEDVKLARRILDSSGASAES